MRLIAALVLLGMSASGLAQLGPSTGSTQRDGAQPAGTVQQPDRRLQAPLQPPPQNPQPLGGTLGGPIQETGNYGNLGLGAGTSPGARDTPPRSLVQPDYRRTDEETPFQRR